MAQVLDSPLRKNQSLALGMGWMLAQALYPDDSVSGGRAIPFHEVHLHLPFPFHLHLSSSNEGKSRLDLHQRVRRLADVHPPCFAG